MAATCKACGAPISWIETPNKKWIPCDEGLVPYKQDSAGPEAVVTQGGQVIRCRFDYTGFPTGMARVPHWATCPDADKHRKR